MGRWSSFVRFVRGVGEALAFIAAFVGGGVWWAGQLAGEPLPAAGAAPALYAPGMEDPAPEPRLWLVDGYNVLNVGVLAGRSRERWWSGERRAELLERVGAFEASGATVRVVFDGDDPGGGPAGGAVETVFAPDADDYLLAQIRAAGEGVALVTADRRLAARARHRGARVVSPGEFLARCQQVG